MEKGSYAQVVMLRQNYLNITEENENKNKYKLKFQCQSEISQHFSVLICIGWNKNIAHVNLISIRKSFKVIMKNKIQIHSKCLKFQLSMTKTWRK